MSSILNTVLCVASAGGHWVQLRRLAPALDGFKVVYLSTDPGYENEVKPARFYSVDDANRGQDRPGENGAAYMLAPDLYSAQGNHFYRRRTRLFCSQNGKDPWRKHCLDRQSCQLITKRAKINFWEHDREPENNYYYSPL